MTPSLKILFVDDDPNLLAAFQRNLRRQFTFDTALGGQEGLELLRTQGPYALLLVDMRMPGMDGIEFLERAQALAPDAVRMMLTGNADQQTAVEAVNRGHVFRFLNKPCPPEVLVPALEHGLKQFEMLRMERELLEGTLTGSVKVMTEVLGMVAPDALGRGQRLRESMRLFAHSIGATPAWELEVAALLSPIGLASLPARVLQKISSGLDLAPGEQAVLRRVPQIGHDLLAAIPRLGGVARIVLYQNKSFDGGGFPADENSGEHIPLGARMLKILGDRLTLENEGVVKQRAFETMKAREGVYDQRLLACCFVCFQAFLTNAISAETPVRTLYIKELLEGQVVVSDITTPEGLVLVGAGNRLTAMVLARLHNYDELNEVKQPVLVQDPALPSSAESDRKVA
jgi:response regulator RpfG family c-di-GMP phosphodiesterase